MPSPCFSSCHPQYLPQNCSSRFKSTPQGGVQNLFNLPASLAKLLSASMSFLSRSTILRFFSILEGVTDLGRTTCRPIKAIRRRARVFWHNKGCKELTDDSPIVQVRKQDGPSLDLVLLDEVLYQRLLHEGASSGSEGRVRLELDAGYDQRI